MAIDPSAKYPSQIDTSDPTGYPRGKAQNIGVPGDGTGTPWEKDLVNDLLGFQQDLLDRAGDTPSGTPDKVGASQYANAIQTMIDAPIVNPSGLTVRRRLSLADGSPANAAGIPKWERVLSTTWVWRSRSSPSQPLFFGVNSYVADVTDDVATTVPLRGVILDEVTVQMQPGAARTGTNRMLVELVQMKIVAGAHSESVIASAYGVASSTSFDTLSQTGIGHTFDPTADYEIRITSGNDADVNQDRVYMVILGYQPTKLPI